MSRENRDAAQERERMPYIQVDADLWIVMREDKTRPRAVIERVQWHDGSEQYMLKTWHPEPGQRRLVRIHDTLEDANRSVKWRDPKTVTPSIPPEHFVDNPQAQALRQAQARSVS